MLDKNVQEANNIKDSFVQQANGNINNYIEVTAELSQSIIDEYLSSFTKEAMDLFKKRIAEFERLFVEKLENIDIPHAKEELKTPHMQIIMHNTMGEYGKSENPNTREGLLDLLIERLKVETDNEKTLIEEAIKILPSITDKQGKLLASLFLRDQIHFMLFSTRKPSLNSLINYIFILGSLCISLWFGSYNLTEINKIVVHFRDFFYDPKIFFTLLIEVGKSFFYGVIDFLSVFLPIFLFYLIAFYIPVKFLVHYIFLFHDRFMKRDSIKILLQNTEILYHYVLMEKNDSYDVDHLKQIHCCSDDRKRNIFQQIKMAKEINRIVFRYIKPIIPFRPFILKYFNSIKYIYDRQKVISNIRLTPVGEYIGKRFFDRIKKQIYPYNCFINNKNNKINKLIIIWKSILGK